jgi:hypothetical protein
MSRSKHTDPRDIRAARRVRAPAQGRGTDDLSRRREVGRAHKEAGVARESGIPSADRLNGPSRLRIIVRPPRNGFHHPAGEPAILALLNNLGPVAYYGLRTIEMARAPANASAAAGLLFGRYHVPGRIVLYEQPAPPWRLPGLPGAEVTRRLKRAGAAVNVLRGAGATLVNWPRGALRRFMLEEVLLHELGHHVLQQHKGKRPVRVARTRDHEDFAARFARKQRMRLRKQRGVGSA